MPSAHTQDPDGEPRGRTLFAAAALLGVALAFAGPVAILLVSSRTLLAATLGYAGIALFAGGVAARYGFVEHRVPLVQLALNLGIGILVAGFFYGMFLVLYSL